MLINDKRTKPESDSATVEVAEKKWDCYYLSSVGY